MEKKDEEIDMGTIDNAELSRGESVKWILQNVEVDNMADVPFENDDQPGSIPRNTNQTSFERQTSNVRKRNAIPGNNSPSIIRQESGAYRGLRSLRFLDRTITGKEVDAWKAIEKRFNLNAVDGRIFRDKFGVSIGI